MRNIDTIITATIPTITTWDSSAFGMSARGCTVGFHAAFGTEIAVRDRQDIVVKGHVALEAVVPGTPAWSPPIC